MVYTEENFTTLLLLQFYFILPLDEQIYKAMSTTNVVKFQEKHA